MSELSDHETTTGSSAAAAQAQDHLTDERSPELPTVAEANDGVETPAPETVEDRSEEKEDNSKAISASSTADPGTSEVNDETLKLGLRPFRMWLNHRIRDVMPTMAHAGELAIITELTPEGELRLQKDDEGGSFALVPFDERSIVRVLRQVMPRD